MCSEYEQQLSCALPVADMFTALQLDVDKPFVFLGSQQIGINPVGYTWTYRTGTYFPLLLPSAPPRNWVLFAFLPFVGFSFPTTSPACPKLGQASGLSLLLSTCCQHSWPVGAFHALSSLKWMVLKLCPPTLPTSYTALKLPLQLSCPSLSALCIFGSWLRVLQAGSSALALPGWEGGRERAVPCCRWGRLLVQAVLVGPTAAHQTCSLAFPHPKELVLVLPETLLPYASDLEFSPSMQL